MESKPEGQKIERFGGAVRQVQTLAFNKKCCWDMPAASIAQGLSCGNAPTCDPEF
jgi:hypothetical protein